MAEIADFSQTINPAATDKILTQNLAGTTEHQVRAQLHTIQSGEVIDTPSGVNLSLQTEGVQRVRLGSGFLVLLDVNSRLRFGTSMPSLRTTAAAPSLSEQAGSVSMGQDGNVYVNTDGSTTWLPLAVKSYELTGGTQDGSLSTGARTLGMLSVPTLPVSPAAWELVEARFSVDLEGGETITLGIDRLRSDGTVEGSETLPTFDPSNDGESFDITPANAQVKGPMATGDSFRISGLSSGSEDFGAFSWVLVLKQA